MASILTSILNKINNPIDDNHIEEAFKNRKVEAILKLFKSSQFSFEKWANNIIAIDYETGGALIEYLLDNKINIIKDSSEGQIQEFIDVLYSNYFISHSSCVPAGGIEKICTNLYKYCDFIGIDLDTIHQRVTKTQHCSGELNFLIKGFSTILFLVETDEVEVDDKREYKMDLNNYASYQNEYKNYLDLIVRRYPAQENKAQYTGLIMDSGNKTFNMLIDLCLFMPQQMDSNFLNPIYFPYLIKVSILLEYFIERHITLEIEPCNLFEYSQIYYCANKNDIIDISVGKDNRDTTEGKKEIDLMESNFEQSMKSFAEINEILGFQSLMDKLAISSQIEQVDFAVKSDTLKI